MRLTQRHHDVGKRGQDSSKRSRWAKVYAIGPEQEDISIGQWILTDHGRWTRGFKMQDDAGEEKTIRRVDTKDVLLVSNEQPVDGTIGDSA